MMIVIKLFEKGGYFRRSTLSLNLIPCCQVVKYGMLWQAQGLVDLWSQKLQILFWRLTSNCAQLQNALANILIWLKWFLVWSSHQPRLDIKCFLKAMKKNFSTGGSGFWMCIAE